MCQEPLDPINGHVNCTSNVDSLHCILTCEEGYAFAVQPHDYFCTYDSDGSILAPDSTIDPLPDCSCKFLVLCVCGQQLFTNVPVNPDLKFVLRFLVFMGALLWPRLCFICFVFHLFKAFLG